MKYIVLAGVFIDTATDTVLFSVALQETQKLGLYNYAELEDGETPHADTRFTLPEAKMVRDHLRDQLSHRDVLGGKSTLVRIVSVDESNMDHGGKLNTELIQYEIDSLKQWRQALKKNLAKLGRTKEFNF